MKKVIYLAGPMSGIEQDNKPAFHQAAAVLEQDFIVLSPASLPSGLTQRQYMDICYAMIRACDLMFLLPNWQESAGAVAEFHYAKKIELPTNEYSAEAATA